jgi:hypothetical protein
MTNDATQVKPGLFVANRSTSVFASPREAQHAPNCELNCWGWLDATQKEYRHEDGRVQIGAHWGEGRDSCPHRDAVCTCKTRQS